MWDCTLIDPWRFYKLPIQLQPAAAQEVLSFGGFAEPDLEYAKTAPPLLLLLLR
eukprot:COSAG05_NODE_21209_length_273_cov_1.488506_1_plen_53_part_01